MKEPSWDTATGTARGSQHDRRGLPNQDAVRTVEFAELDAVVAAVSDGHGGSAYVRSDVGSRLAVDHAIGVATALLGTADDPVSPAQLRTAVERTTGALIVEQWRSAVSADVAKRPFTDEERARAGIDLDHDVHIAYGATLLLAMVVGGHVFLLQLGDGDCVVASSTGVRRPMPGDSRLVAGETTSLCLSTAATDFRFAALQPDDGVNLLLLCSDGYGNSFAEPAWYTTVATDLRDTIDKSGMTVVRTQLEGWLAESALIGGDDVSVALVARATSPRANNKVVPPRGRHLGRLAALVVVAVLAAALGVLLGWLARGGEPAVAVTSSPTSSSGPTAIPRGGPHTGPPTAATPPVAGALPRDDQARGVLVGSKGAVVLFVANPQHPQPVVVLATSTQSRGLRVRVGEQIWSVRGGHLVVGLGPDRRTVSVVADGSAQPRVLSATVAGGLVWALLQGDQVVAVDPQEHRALGDPVAAVQHTNNEQP